MCKHHAAAGLLLQATLDKFLKISKFIKITRLACCVAKNAYC